MGRWATSRQPSVWNKADTVGRRRGINLLPTQPKSAAGVGDSTMYRLHRSTIQPRTTMIRPGPFGEDRSARRPGDLGAALGTSLLVMYPVIGAVVAFLAGVAASSHILG